MQKSKENPPVALTAPEFIRLANNFYNSRNIISDLGRTQLDMDLVNYLAANNASLKKRFKVAFICICLNPPYWEFIRRMIEGSNQSFALSGHQCYDVGAKNLFLPGHDVDYFLWSDVPETEEEVRKKATDECTARGLTLEQAGGEEGLGNLYKEVQAIRAMPNLTIFPTESVEWPMPTLLRYHLFLQQEEVLKDYDYIFYCDVDMVFTNVVGDEILGDGLTTGVNPMYYLDKSMYPPYEPNPDSAAYIPRPGRLVEESGQKRFQPLYYAGGFQGGKTEAYITAMKVIKERIDEDLRKNYTAIWNEESHWNKYLFENPPSVVLDPSYIYPDSLHSEYYIPRWGKEYHPKLVTLTKKHTLRPLSQEEQNQLNMMAKK